jgi:hypothetical protein
MLASQSFLGSARESFGYLLPEVVQFVCGATNTSTVRLLQLESLHGVSCESVGWHFAVLQTSVCEQAAGPCLLIVCCQRSFFYMDIGGVVRSFLAHIC